MTSAGKMEVDLWTMGDNSSDLIKQVPDKTVTVPAAVTHPECSLRLSNIADNKMVVGSQLKNLTVIDLEHFTNVRSLESQGNMG